MAFILTSTEDGGDYLIALHKSIDELKEDRRTSYINTDEYVVKFEGEYFQYRNCDTVAFEPKVIKDEKPN